MDGTEGASGLDQLHQFDVAGEKPLQAVRTREGRTGGRGPPAFYSMRSERKIRGGARPVPETSTRCWC